MRVRVTVALAPALLGEPGGRVCVVVDVLRACSTMVTMFQRGVAEVVVAAGVEEARRLARELDAGWLLCGEAGGLPPPGFHYGNSPSQFSRLELGGRRVVFATSNGTRALAQVAAAPLVLAGALLNATAAARAALATAAPTQGVAIVCAGEEGGRAFALEDAIGAGAIVAAMAEQSELELSDGARAALALYQAHQGDLAAALALSEHGRQLARLGLAEDLAFCARRDLYPLVPRLERDRAGRLVLRAAVSTP